MLNQSIAVWRAGASYDLTGSGRTAVKASYSRYGLQVGIDRVTNVNPLTVGTRDCPWTDPNGDGKVQAGELPATCPRVQRRHHSPATPTASTGRTRTKPPPASRPSSPAPCASARCSTTAPTASRSARSTPCSRQSAYTSHTITVPNGPGGTVANPKPTTATVFNISPAANAVTLNVRDNVDYLDTTYKGIEFTATKRFSQKWQMQAGFTIGKNEGGVTGRHRPQRPEQHPVPDRHHRQRLGNRVPAVGQLQAARQDQPRRLDDCQQRLPLRLDLHR